MVAVSQLKWLHGHAPSAGAEQGPREQLLTPVIGREEGEKERKRKPVQATRLCTVLKVCVKESGAQDVTRQYQVSGKAKEKGRSKVITNPFPTKLYDVSAPYLWVKPYFSLPCPAPLLSPIFDSPSSSSSPHPVPRLCLCICWEFTECARQWQLGDTLARVGSVAFTRTCPSLISLLG